VAAGAADAAACDGGGCGASVRNATTGVERVIAAANRHGIAMILTGRRHFKH